MRSRFFPHIVTEPAAYVLVGMGGFFAGVAKTPIAALIMVAEMTGGVQPDRSHADCFVVILSPSGRCVSLRETSSDSC